MYISIILHVCYVIMYYRERLLWKLGGGFPKDSHTGDVPYLCGTHASFRS